MTYKEAISVASLAVGESHLEGQRHVDLSLTVAEKREKVQKALMWLRAYIARGEVTEDRVKEDLGITVKV